jgi:DNA-binding winged helix-turn-helix (wHTH) protein/predicted ATPase
MEKHRLIAFDVFTLDPVSESLWRGQERIHLRPKTFAFLHYLAAHPAQMITKERLLDVLWKDCYVGDGALKHCVAEIRRALCDPAEAPRFIETAHRRGYRFIGEVSKDAQWASIVQQGQGPVPGGHLVGRTTEFAMLNHLLKRAMGGTRQVVFVTGEQGIGKTSLVDAFLTPLNPEGQDRPGSFKEVSIARGQCIKSHGAGEAYMPVCEALTGLCQTAERKRILSILRQHSPLWLLQMSSLISTAQFRNLQRATLSATREGMLREMAEALEAMAADVPLVLVLEDLHWSDYSTLDLISYLAQRRAPARLLVIGTYRPAEAMAEDNPLKTLKNELKAHQQCQELPLGYLNEGAISEYLMQRFTGHSFPAETAGWIHQRTEGNPLFMINVLDHLVARGFIARRDKSWVLNLTLDKAEFEVPPTIQEIIERQIELCTNQEQHLIEAASVAGMEFSIPSAAAFLCERADRIERKCRGLAQRNLFLQAGETRQLAGGGRESCYRFIHAAYQSICYQRLPEQLKTRIHRRVAEYIERTNRKQPGELAARLAMHFEQGHEYPRAAKYYLRAAENANARYAGREALGLVTRGLQLLERIPDNPDRTELEMCLQIALGTGLMSARGMGTEEVSKAFGRARQLFQQLSKYRRSSRRSFLFSAVFGLWNYHWVRAEYAVARELAEQLLQMAKADGNPLLLNQARHSLGIIMMDHGEFAGALEQLKHCTGVVSRCCAAFTIWTLGYPDQALKSIEATLEHALETRNAENCIFAHLGAARVHVGRRESKKALDRAQSALDLAVQHGLVEQWLAPMKIIHGWAMAKLGKVSAGFDQMNQALNVVRAVGNSNLKPLLWALFAEIAMDAGRINEGSAALEDALEAAHSTRMHHYDAEIYRIKGELLLCQSRASGELDPNDPPVRKAESAFEEAIKTARQQQAKSFELRATTSLARLIQKQNRPAEARDRLAKIHDWFKEGHDAPDLCEARDLIRELTSSAGYRTQRGRS